MTDLKTLEAKVRMILKDNSRARDDDRELTLQVWERFYGVNHWASVGETMRNPKLPSQESIGRARRKIQETEFELRGSKQKEKIRMDAQLTFIEYALSDRM